MVSRIIPSWRTLALQAVVHLGTARILLDLILDDAPEEPLADKLRSIGGEVLATQDLVRQIAGATL